MQISAINPPSLCLFLSLSFLNTHTPTHWVMKFVWPTFSQCLLSETDHEWAEPCGSTLLIFHL